MTPKGGWCKPCLTYFENMSIDCGGPGALKVVRLTPRGVVHVAYFGEPHVFCGRLNEEF